MLGTFAGALDARKIDAKKGRLTADVRGEVEEEDKVLIIRRVHVTFQLRTGIPDEIREAVDRVHRVYAERCPVYRSLKPAFAISSSFTLTPEEAAEKRQFQVSP
jgi:uncharacterized OsmC-like protein